MGDTTRELELLIACSESDMSGREVLQGTKPIVEQEEILEIFAEAGKLGTPGGYNVVSYVEEAPPRTNLDHPFDYELL